MLFIKKLMKIIVSTWLAFYFLLFYSASGCPIANRNKMRVLESGGTVEQHKAAIAAVTAAAKFDSLNCPPTGCEPFLPPHRPLQPPPPPPPPPQPQAPIAKKSTPTTLKYHSTSAHDDMANHVYKHHTSKLKIVTFISCLMHANNIFPTVKK